MSYIPTPAGTPTYEELHTERGQLQAALSKPYTFESPHERQKARQRFKDLTATLNRLYRESRGL